MEPILGFAQSNVSTNELGYLAYLTDRLQAGVIFSQSEQRTWEQIIDDQQLADKDKRLTNYILPSLVEEFGQLHVDILKDYSTPEQQKSRLLANSVGISPRYFAKATSVTSLGTINCTDSSASFARELELAKPLWLNRQLKSPNDLIDAKANNFFGRSFDLAARQGLNLPLRSITNRLTSELTWSGLLQQLATAEIEERFDLKTGVLANIPSSELDLAIARARLSRQIALGNLPTTQDTQSSFTLDKPTLKASLGQQIVEQTLNLPQNSFTSLSKTRFWYETYQNIGWRVLEEELAIPIDEQTSSPFPTSTSLTELPRFQLLAKKLAQRGEIYKNPVLALGLPTEGYLPTATGESDIYQQVLNGDPDALATIGAYFLADSLQLSSSATAELVQAVRRGENRAINLATARPLPSELQAETLFKGDSTLKERNQTLSLVGESSHQALTAQLARINGNVLLAITGNNQAPSLNQIESILRDQSKKAEILEKLAKFSANDADYPDGLTAAALQRRGEQLLAEAINLDSTEIQQLSEPTDSAIVLSIGQKVDSALGWPSLNDQPLSRQLATKSLTERQLLEVGIDQLWNKFRFYDELKVALNSYFFDYLIQPVNRREPSLTDQNEETVTIDEPSNSDGSASDQTDTDEDTAKDSGDEEIVIFKILKDFHQDETSITDALTAVTGLDAEALVPILSGRFNSGLKLFTLSTMAKILSENSTITTTKLLNLYDQPTVNGVESITNQATAVSENGFILPSFFTDLTNIANEEQVKNAWQIIDQEIYRQWNIDCPLKTEAVNRNLERLIDKVMEWPATTNEPSQEPTRPVQIFTFNPESFSEKIQTKISTSYPKDRQSKSGVFPNPRNWDDIYIGL